MMYIPYVWQLGGDDTQRWLRHIRVMVLRRLPVLHIPRKAWS
ncbi:hypothetical protein [Solirubrum puertoriconensis]|nr:hypothetical protein [Solirubrum puertoriconensis]